MRSQTITLIIPAGRDELFGWLSEINNLPAWASHFCRRLWWDPAGWQMLSVAGEVLLALESDAATGVIDLFWGKHRDEMTLIPLRVVSLPHGSAISLSCFATAQVPGEIYEALVRALTADLRALQNRFGAGELNTSLPRAFSPGVVTAKFYETWDFYTAVLGFKTVKESDAFVQLCHPSGTQLNILRHEVDGAPSELIASADGRGFWLSIEVPDADEEFRRLNEMKVELAEEPSDRAWGERMFFLRDPNGVLISIWHPLPNEIAEFSDDRLIGV